jgi:hypothetical protein
MIKMKILAEDKERKKRGRYIKHKTSEARHEAIKSSKRKYWHRTHSPKEKSELAKIFEKRVSDLETQVETLSSDMHKIKMKLWQDEI